MWDTSHGYLDKGTPLLVKKISERSLQAMAFTSNGRLLSVTDGYVEYRLAVDNLNGPIRALPMAGPGQEPRNLTGLVADPFNRYILAAHQDGLTFHPLFDTNWRADLSALGSGAMALAISADARLMAVALADGRFLLGLAPNQLQPSFLPVRRMESSQIRYLGFAADSSHLLASSRAGVGIYSLDWDLESPRLRAWDKKAGVALSNIVARYAPSAYTEAMGQDFLLELSQAGLTGLDPKVATSRLKEALDRLN
jgi:hypothetical protein